MFPYNWKVWAHPLEVMDKQWIAERVSVVDLETALRNILTEAKDSNWGPNATFKFPLRGGTGGFYEPFVPYITGPPQLQQASRLPSTTAQRWSASLMAAPITTTSC